MVSAVQLRGRRLPSQDSLIPAGTVNPRRASEHLLPRQTDSNRGARTQILSPTSRGGITLSLKSERVAYIADVMSRNEWPVWPESLAFRKKLAEEWGLSESTVRDYAAEAHRIVAIDPEERERLREEIAKRMKRLADDAEQRQNMITGLPDYGSAIKALDMHAKYAGIELEQKLKLSGAVQLEDIDALRKRIEGGDGGEAGGTG